MKFSVAAILALSAVPAHSFSYLDSLGSVSVRTASAPVDIAPPVPAAAAPAPDPPFYFTNGAQDQPLDSPAFFFTSDAPAAATSSGSYLDNLNGGGGGGGSPSTPSPPPPASSAPAASSVTTAAYLDFLGNGATSVSGPGMPNYLDVLPQNSAVGGGPGLPSYASSLNQAASEVIAAAAPSAPQVAAPVAAATAEVPIPYDNVPDATTMPLAANSKLYLDALSTGSSTSGAGIASYVDSLPQTSTLSGGGSGINTYAGNLISSSVIHGSGVPTYTDALGGGINSFTNSFSPFGAAAKASSGTGQSDFAIGSVNGRFDLTLVADDELIAQLRAGAASNGKVTIRGKMMLN